MKLYANYNRGKIDIEYFFRFLVFTYNDATMTGSVIIHD